MKEKAAPLAAYPGCIKEGFMMDDRNEAAVGMGNALEAGEREVYEKPEIVALGKLSTLIQGATGNGLDAFPHDGIGGHS